MTPATAYWGFSPASDPFGGYAEYGVDLARHALGRLHVGREKTDVDIDRPGCTVGTNPDPEFGDGVVTPHASFLALPYDREGVLANLAHIETDLGAYGPGGFYDSVAVGERHGRGALPLAGPVDDHGGDRQRTDRR